MFRFIMFLLLLLASAGGAEETRFYSETRRMVGTDLGVERVEKGEVRSYRKGRYKTVNGKVEAEATDEVVKEWTTRTYRTTLSLQPGDNWHKGKAWTVRENEAAKVQDDGKKVVNSRSYLAFRGHYQIFLTKDKDVLLLRLGMVRSYAGTVGEDGIKWEAVARREPVGMDFEFTAADGVIPAKPTLVAKEAFFVDEDDGTTKVLKYHEPQTLKEELFGKRELRKAKCDFMGLGESVKFVPRKVTKADTWSEDLPPGIVLRK